MTILWENIIITLIALFVIIFIVYLGVLLFKRLRKN